MGTASAAMGTTLGAFLGAAALGGAWRFFAGAAPAVSRAFLVSSTRFTVYEGVHDRLRRHTPPA